MVELLFSHFQVTKVNLINKKNSLNISVWEWYGLRHSITFHRILFCMFCCKCMCIVDQMLQNSTKQFHAFSKRTILIQRIISTFNERTILIQWIICAFSWVTILIQRFIDLFNEIFMYSTVNFEFFTCSTIQKFSLQSCTEVVPKFSTWFLGSSGKCFHKNMLLRPKISLRVVFIIWYSNRTNFLKIHVFSQDT